MRDEIYLPKLNSNDEKARLTCWIVEPGLQVTKGQVIASFETTKSSFEVEASIAGWFHSNLAVGDYVSFGDSIGFISDSARASTPAVQRQNSTNSRKVSKKAQELILAHKIPIDLIKSSSEIILEKDVLEYLNMKAVKITTAPEQTINEETIERVRIIHETLESLRSEMKRKFNRHVPAGTLLNDRCSLAKDWGFGDGSSVYDECLIFGEVTVGKNCWIGPFTILDGSGGGLEIGDWTSIGSGTHVYTHHTIDQSLTGGQVKPFRSPTSIGKSCFIAPYVMIGPGSAIGSHCFVTAFSYVEGSFPDNSIISGNPAKVVGKIHVHGSHITKTFF